MNRDFHGVSVVASMETNSFYSKLLVPQVQEAHGLQEEETPAYDQETTISPPPSDSAQGQLRKNLLYACNCRWHHYTPTSASSTVHNPAKLWCETLTQQVSNTYLNHGRCDISTTLLNVHVRFVFTQTNNDTVSPRLLWKFKLFIFLCFYQ